MAAALLKDKAKVKKKFGKKRFRIFGLRLFFPLRASEACPFFRRNPSYPGVFLPLTPETDKGEKIRKQKTVHGRGGKRRKWRVLLFIWEG